MLGFYCCIALRHGRTVQWVVHPKLTDAFAAQHDASMRRALSQLLSVDPSSMCWDVASLPFFRGGHGVAQRRFDLAGSVLV